MNVYVTLANTAAKWPDRIAIVDAYGALTFKDLFAQTEAVKENLIRAGISNGHGIGIVIPNSRHFHIALFAALGCQAVVMPIGYQTAGEIAGAISDADLHFVMSEKGKSLGIEKLKRIHFENDFMELRMTDRRKDQPTVPFIPDAALMRFTSGTTGTAKCVILSHRAVLERTQAANEGLGLFRPIVYCGCFQWPFILLSRLSCTCDTE